MEDEAEKISDIRDAANIGSRNGGIDLSQKDEEFIDSIEDQLSDDRSLSERQTEWLTDIWERI